MTKQDMIKFIGDNYNNITDKSLKDRIAYFQKKFLEDPKQIKTTDLRSIMKDVESNIKSEEDSEPVVDNSIKKPLKKSPTKKTSANKTNNKVEKSKEYKATDLAVNFPDRIDISQGTLVKANDITNFQEFKKAFNEDDEVFFFAIYWTKRHLKQFGYVNIPTIEQPNEFKDDLDIVQCIYVSQERDSIAFGVSMYTDAPYSFIPEHFDVFDGMRFAYGMEFELYRLE